MRDPASHPPSIKGEVSRKKGSVQSVTRSGAVTRADASRLQPKDLFSDLPHLVWMTDASGLCTYINETFSAFTGASVESFLQESWTRFLHPHDVAETTTRWLSSVRQQTSHQAQYRIKRHDNVYRWMLARAVPVRDASGCVTRWVGTNTDIHELREKWHGSQNCGISEQDLMVAWARDIRMPLITARLNAQMTLLYPDNPQYTAEKMNVVLQDMNRIDTMMRNLRNDKSPKGIGVVAARTPSDLRAILTTSIRRLSALYPKRLLVVLPERDVLGSWNAIAIQRALETLVGNAALYGAADTPVNVSLCCSQGRTTISVHNYGPALSSEAQRIIFGPCVRVSESRRPGEPRGGLGLPIVKRIAEDHGGFVEAETSDSEGTTFRVVLPLG